LIILGRQKRMIASWTIATAVVAFVVSLILPRTFTGVTRILPPQQGQSTAAMMLGQLGGGFGGIGGLAGAALGIKNPSDLYIGMLKSETVADALIERFKLKDLFDEKYRVDARKRLAEDSFFRAEKSGIIAIQVDARDPTLAADLANAYVEQLYKLTSTLAISEAAQRRAFFERHLLETKDRLADAEVKLRQAIESGGLVSVDVQGRAAVEMVARLRAQISAKEIQIGAMKAYATQSNPDLQRAERELSSMRQELSRLESGVPAGDGAGLGDAKGLVNIRLLREVKYNEVMFELLAKQYEMARVDEAKEAPLIQVLDRAVPPEKRSFPKRTLIVAAATMFGLITAVLAAFARNALQIARQDPVRQHRLDAFRAAWSHRKP
jgi:uncharacterized protein involved in exopolysaccharide biosynthesis